jgi:hypothetical protein
VFTTLLPWTYFRRGGLANKGAMEECMRCAEAGQDANVVEVGTRLFRRFMVKWARLGVSVLVAFSWMQGVKADSQNEFADGRLADQNGDQVPNGQHATKGPSCEHVGDAEMAFNCDVPVTSANASPLVAPLS